MDIRKHFIFNLITCLVFVLGDKTRATLLPLSGILRKLQVIQDNKLYYFNTTNSKKKIYLLNKINKTQLKDMAEKDYILIDIRADSEVYNKHIDTTHIAGQNYTVYVIPMNMIRFNVETIINHLQWVKRIYLVCDTSRRSGYIKQKYFNNVPNIVVEPALQFTHLNSGMNTVTLSNATFNIPIKTQRGLYSIMRIIQIMYGVIFLSCASYLIYSLNNTKCNVSRIPIYIGLALAIMALINGLTNTCSMSMLLKDYLN